MNDPRIFPLGRTQNRASAVDPVELARLISKAETLAECHKLCAAWERHGADAGIIRLMVGQQVSDAWAQVEAFREGALLEAASELEEAVRPASDVASSGAAHPLPPSAPLHIDDGFLRGVARGLDMAYRALGTPRPWDREKPADTPRLRVVE